MVSSRNKTTTIWCFLCFLCVATFLGLSPRLCSSAVTKSVRETRNQKRETDLSREQKLFRLQLPDRVPELGGFFELEALGLLAHVGFQLHDVGVEFFLRLEFGNAVGSDLSQVGVIGGHDLGQR